MVVLCNLLEYPFPLYSSVHAHNKVDVRDNWGQMNKKLEILNLQRQIKADLNRLNWSIASFASKYLIDNSEYDIEEHEVKTFQERVKKQLTRSTTNPQLLLKYYQFICNSEEYKKLEDKCEKRYIQPLTGLISDYVCLLNEAQDETERTVLEVAAAHALSVGTAWDFHITQIIMMILTEVSYALGGCSDMVVVQVLTPRCGCTSRWGALFVRKTDYSFNTGLRTVSEILGFNDGLLKLRGLDYDKGDANNFPSLVYDVELLELHGVWSLTSKRLVSTRNA